MHSGLRVVRGGVVVQQLLARDSWEFQDGCVEAFVASWRGAVQQRRTMLVFVRGARRRRLKIAAAWPWADAIITAWERLITLPNAP